MIQVVNDNTRQSDWSCLSCQFWLDPGDAQLIIVRQIFISVHLW
jgi:hypothetical protein